MATSKHISRVSKSMSKARERVSTENTGEICATPVEGISVPPLVDSGSECDSDIEKDMVLGLVQRSTDPYIKATKTKGRFLVRATLYNPG